MVHKLTNKELAENWKSMLSNLRKAFTISDDEEKILFNLAMIDQAQFWFGYSSEDKELPAFIVVTGFTTMFGQTDRYLLINYLVSAQENPIDIKVWEASFNILKEYGKMHKCTKIVAMIDTPHLYQILEQFATIKVRAALEVIL